jgi:SAM-dependent methyltransferase
MVGGKATAPGVADGLQKIFEKHELHEGGRVLDLACGIGRISINLAKRGYYVVGTDLSPSYLQHAEKWAHKEGLTHQVQFYRMDSSDAARQFRRREQKKFDAIINIGTAMGYYGDEDDLQTFTSLRAITYPHAILVIHTVNRDYLIKHFQPHSISRIGDIEWHEIRKLNTETSSMENIWRFYTKKRGSLQLGLEIPISHRVYSLHELKLLVESAGWKYLESFGSLRELSPLTSDSIQMTVVSQKR